MSEDEELDKLLFSIPKSSKRKKETDSKENPQVEESKQPATKSGESGQDPGFDPLDLIDLEDQQGSLITWLTRHRQATLSDIQEALAIPQEDLEDLLGQLLEAQRIKSVERDGETTYSVSIHGRASRRLRGFPEDLWKKAGLDDG